MKFMYVKMGVFLSVQFLFCFIYNGLHLKQQWRIFKISLFPLLRLTQILVLCLGLSQIPLCVQLIREFVLMEFALNSLFYSVGFICLKCSVGNGKKLLLLAAVYFVSVIPFSFHKRMTYPGHEGTSTPVRVHIFLSYSCHLCIVIV